MTTITRAAAHDIRFPTSLDLSGSDAMNEATDYSAEMKPSPGVWARIGYSRFSRRSARALPRN